MTRNQIFQYGWCLALMCPLAIFALRSEACAQDAKGQPAAGKTVRLLTIGNSFSRNATRYLDKLAAAGGQTLIHRPIIVGGASMELHATKALKHQENADDPAGKYADGSSLQQRLAEQPWDIVTIQQASRLSPHAETFRPFAAQLQEIVRAHAPQARLMIHETWAYRVDDPWFVQPSKDSENPATQDEMYHQLQNSYRTIAGVLGAGIIPVGDAFHLATQDQKWSYRPDTKFRFDEARFPDLPDQTHSLNVGWRWVTTKGKKTLSIDGHHANAAGEYLGGCVFYEVLFQDDVRKNTFVPENIAPQFAAFLRDTAHQAVQESAKRPE